MSAQTFDPALDAVRSQQARPHREQCPNWIFNIAYCDLDFSLYKPGQGTQGSSAYARQIEFMELSGPGPEQQNEGSMDGSLEARQRRADFESQILIVSRTETYTD